MKIHFVTPTKLSILDISSMGDSSKRGDDTTIGQFDSGLKYAIALLLRDNVKIKIDIHNNGELENNFTFGQKKIEDSQTGKDKNLITIFDINGVETVTGFAFNLGYNWKNWMSYREIMSNVLDEKGFAYDSTQWKQFPDSIEYNGTNTVITLEFDESNEFFEVWQNRHLYMNFEEPLFKVSSSVECLENKERYLRIYKQNILVYEDKDRPSRFAWNIKFGDIDERRILSNLYSVEQSIAYAIQDTNNEEFLRHIITSSFQTEEKEFLSTNSYYSDWISDTVKKVAHEVYEEFGEVRSYDWLIDKVKKQKDCKIAGKKIKTIYNGYSLRLGADVSMFKDSPSNILLLILGRIDTGKNGLKTLQALALFYQKNGYCPTVLWAGRQEKDPSSLRERNQIEELLTQNPEIANHWLFLDERRDVADLLKQADGLIHVSLYEGLPNAVCEAFVAARPVIASNVCDHPKLVEDGIRGIMCDPLSPESICEAMDRFVLLPVKDRQQMGRNARAYAEQYLTIDRMVADYEALILDAC
jgi:glycosyltransferase involved in cell wall biosynthesis